MTNLETNLLEVLTREAVRFCSRAFSGPARANAYGPHTGLLSMVLQRKRLQGRTGHITNVFMLRVHHFFKLISFFLAILIGTKRVGESKSVLQTKVC